MSAKAAAPAPRALDSAAVRTHFPAIRPGGPVFFDNPAGTPVCTESLERMRDYLLNRNANHGGAFRASRESDAMVRDTRAAGAG
jgi:selenocysteine lyase/cysteine desulfurase